MIKNVLRWALKSELIKLNFEIEEAKKLNNQNRALNNNLHNVLKNIDVSVDVHEYHRYSRSWAVISIQGNTSDFIKFIDLGEAEIIEIQRFLRNFDRSKIDATPCTTKFLKY